MLYLFDVCPIYGNASFENEKKVDFIIKVTEQLVLSFRHHYDINIFIAVA